MSRLRVGHAPSDWRTEEPRAAHVVSRGGSLAVGISVSERDRLYAKARELERGSFERTDDASNAQTKRPAGRVGARGGPA